MRFPRADSRESPIAGRAGPAAIIYNPGLLRAATCQDDRYFISSPSPLFGKKDSPFTAFFLSNGICRTEPRSPPLPSSRPPPGRVGFGKAPRLPCCDQSGHLLLRP